MFLIGSFHFFFHWCKRWCLSAAACDCVQVINTALCNLASCVFFVCDRQGAASCSSRRCSTTRCGPCGETDKRCDASCESGKHLPARSFLLSSVARREGWTQTSASGWVSAGGRSLRVPFLAATTVTVAWSRQCLSITARVSRRSLWAYPLTESLKM